MCGRPLSLSAECNLSFSALLVTEPPFQHQATTFLVHLMVPSVSVLHSSVSGGDESKMIPIRLIYQPRTHMTNRHPNKVSMDYGFVVPPSLRLWINYPEQISWTQTGRHSDSQKTGLKYLINRLVQCFQITFKWLLIIRNRRELSPLLLTVLSTLM